jgi:hypothetical protein
MRKTLILTLVLCVFASLAYAQAGSTGSTAATTGSSTSATTGTTTTTTTTTTHAKHHKAAGKSVRGSVASVDATAKSFVVHPKKGEDVTVKVNDKTKYTPKGKAWDDVKAGENVTVGYKNDGTDNWATTVHFAKAPKTTGTAATTGTGTTGR